MFFVCRAGKKAVIMPRTHKIGYFGAKWQVYVNCLHAAHVQNEWIIACSRWFTRSDANCSVNYSNGLFQEILQSRKQIMCWLEHGIWLVNGCTFGFFYQLCVCFRSAFPSTVLFVWRSMFWAQKKRALNTKTTSRQVWPMNEMALWQMLFL